MKSIFFLLALTGAIILTTTQAQAQQAYQPEDIIFSAGGVIDFTENVSRGRGDAQKDVGQFTKIEEVGYLWGGALLARKSVLEEVGLFDSGYVGYWFEDTDISVRKKKQVMELFLIHMQKYDIAHMYLFWCCFLDKYDVSHIQTVLKWPGCNFFLVKFIEFKPCVKIVIELVCFMVH